MEEVKIKYNGITYNATYKGGFYEIEVPAQETGGIYQAEVEFTDLYGDKYSEIKDIQIFKKEKIELEQEKIFMWIFSFKDFTVKDIVEIADFEINLDEETNATSTIDIVKKIDVKSRDLIAIKKNNEIIYWGIVQEVQNENKKYQIITRYITNMFDREIKLEKENIIRETGIEDFIYNAIKDNFTNSADTFINIDYLELKINSHTKKEVSVTNAENEIYNLHTWMTNCTQNYNIVFDFSVENKKLVLSIENKESKKELIDTKAMNIINYNEVFETDVVSKVEVLYKMKNQVENKGSLILYLLNDRTTTQDSSNPNRADGRITTVYTENYEDAMQTALDVMKSNSYNHNISFNYNRYYKLGTPIAIKTKDSIIYDTYISSIKLTKKKYIEYQCGNIRVKFIEKILQERSK